MRKRQYPEYICPKCHHPMKRIMAWGDPNSFTEDRSKYADEIICFRCRINYDGYNSKHTPEYLAYIRHLNRIIDRQ